MTKLNSGIEGKGKVVPLLVTGLLIASVVALVLNRSFYDRIAADAFFSITLGSTAIVFLQVRPRWEVLQLVIVTCFLVLIQSLVLRVSLRSMPALALLGTGSLGLLAYRQTYGAGKERKLLYYAFFPSLLLVLLGYVSSSLLEITDRVHPSTLDLFLYRFDASLGFQPSFDVAQVVLRSWWITRIALLFYFALPVPIMLIYAKQLARIGSGAMVVFLGFFIIGPAGVIFYNLLPACGPIYLFGARFPFEPFATQQIKEMVLHPVAISGVRNAFPSLHVAWALLASWYAEGLSNWTKVFGRIFLAGTVLACLGLGEHYFIDLIAAIPFAMMIQAACALQIPWLDRRRLMPFLAGLLLLLIWVVLLRGGLSIMWVSPLIPWTLIAGTVIPCVILQSQLRRRLAAIVQRPELSGCFEATTRRKI
jgi:hypothetical protein